MSNDARAVRVVESWLRTVLVSRPAVVIVVALVAGIALGSGGLHNPIAPTPVSSYATAASDTTWPCCLFVFLLLLGGRGLRRTRRRPLPQGRLSLVLACFLAFGAVGYGRIAETRESHNAFLDAVAHADTVSGTVNGQADHDTGATRFVFRQTAGEGALRVTVAGDANEQNWARLRPGAQVILRGPLDAKTRRRNPGEFDYARFLFARSIAGAVFVTDVDAIDVDTTGLDAESAAATSRTSLRLCIRRVRERFASAIDKHATARSAPVLHALLLGNRTRLDEELTETLSRVGLIHLLAVSGLHVLLVGFVLHRLLFSLLIRTSLSWRRLECIRTPLTIAWLAFYAALTGGAPSVVRAVIMGSLLLSRTIVRRPTDSLNTLAVAGVVILFTSPQQLFDVGFQLSFAAVTGIILLANPVGRLLSRRKSPGPLARGISVSLAATIATAPIVASTFGFIPLAGLVLNIVAIPAATAALGSGFLMIAASFFSSGIAELFASTADGAIHLLTVAAATVHAWIPGLAVDVSGQIGQQVVLPVLAIVAVQVARIPSRWMLTICTLTISAVLAWMPVLHSVTADQRIDVIFADVGQGDGVVIRTPGPRFVVIDTGPPGRNSSAATRSMIPILRALGARHIDAILISHAHADHDGGLDDLLRTFGTDLLIASEPRKPGTASKHQSTTAVSGDRVQIGDEITIQILSPPRPLQGAVQRKPAVNDLSIVARLDYRNECVLFTGDIEAATEQLLVEEDGTIDCRLIKVAHHGSRTSSTWPFVKATRTDGGGRSFAVISVGRRNRFGHPHAMVVGRWKAAGRTIVRTSDGAQWFAIDGDGLSLLDWR